MQPHYLIHYKKKDGTSFKCNIYLIFDMGKERLIIIKIISCTKLHAIDVKYYAKWKCCCCSITLGNTVSSENISNGVYYDHNEISRSWEDFETVIAC